MGGCQKNLQDGSILTINLLPISPWIWHEYRPTIERLASYNLGKFWSNPVHAEGDQLKGLDNQSNGPHVYKHIALLVIEKCL